MMGFGVISIEGLTRAKALSGALVLVTQLFVTTMVIERQGAICNVVIVGELPIIGALRFGCDQYRICPVPTRRRGS